MPCVLPQGRSGRGDSGGSASKRSFAPAFLLYPLALSIAIYLYWRFSHAILTLLWVVEVFIVFVLGIYLRTRQFVHVALVALGICIVRLMFFDLANTGLAVRAGVFVGVGILMLAINFVYKKYRDRIS